MKTKLWNKIAVASMSMLACVTCFGVAANAKNVNDVVADTDGNAALPYTLTQTANAGISVTPVSKSSSDGSKTLKGFNLASATPYESICLDSNNSSVWKRNGETVVQKGTSMYYKDHFTFTVGQTLDINKGVSFLMNPNLDMEKGTVRSNRFVMTLSDTPGEITSYTWNYTTNKVKYPNGFSCDGKWFSIESNKYGNADAYANTDNRRHRNAPEFRVGANEPATSITYKASFQGSRKLSDAMAGMYYTYDVGNQYPAYVTYDKQDLLVQVDIFVEGDNLVFDYNTVFETNVNGELVLVDYVDSSADDKYYKDVDFQITYPLADIGFTSLSDLYLSFGYYSDMGGQYTEEQVTAPARNMPADFGLYNLKNGNEYMFTVEDETVDSTAEQTLTASDLAIEYPYFGGTEEYTFVSDNEAVASVSADGKSIVVKKGAEGTANVTATSTGGYSATFAINADCTTVKYNGVVVGTGESYTFTEDLYEGNQVLVGYKTNGKLYAVGDVINLTEDIVLEEVTLNFTMLYGASIRLDDTASIRFTAVLNSVDFAALEAFVGADNVSYGMKLTAKGNTYDINSKNEGFQTGEFGEGYTLYSAVMTGIPDTDYATELTAQAYVKVTFADGDVLEIASKLAEANEGDVKATNVRSLADVAKAAYNDRQATQDDDYKYEDGNGQYSPYTAAQLAEIAKYVQE